MIYWKCSTQPISGASRPLEHSGQSPEWISKSLGPFILYFVSYSSLIKAQGPWFQAFDCLMSRKDLHPNACCQNANIYGSCIRQLYAMRSSLGLEYDRRGKTRLMTLFYFWTCNVLTAKWDNKVYLFLFLKMTFDWLRMSLRHLLFHRCYMLWMQKWQRRHLPYSRCHSQLPYNWRRAGRLSLSFIQS